VQGLEAKLKWEPSQKLVLEVLKLVLEVLEIDPALVFPVELLA
jgi:hypothetical protein